MIYKKRVTFNDKETPRIAILVSDRHIKFNLPDPPTAKESLEC